MRINPLRNEERIFFLLKIREVKLKTGEKVVKSKVRMAVRNKYKKNNERNPEMKEWEEDEN